MVSHNVEEAVYMADRVLIMSPRPGRVVGEVKVNLPRPRTQYLRDPKYFQSVDEVMAVLEKGKREAQVKSQIA
jgi:NitT/TauT family transport system ATP-binding protein